MRHFVGFEPCEAKGRKLAVSLAAVVPIVKAVSLGRQPDLTANVRFLYLLHFANMKYLEQNF